VEICVTSSSAFLIVPDTLTTWKTHGWSTGLGKRVVNVNADQTRR